MYQLSVKRQIKFSLFMWNESWSSFCICKESRILPPIQEKMMHIKLGELIKPDNSILIALLYEGLTRLWETQYHSFSWWYFHSLLNSWIRCKESKHKPDPQLSVTPSVICNRLKTDEQSLVLHDISPSREQALGFLTCPRFSGAFINM